MLEIIGIVSHELAHPVDKLDHVGIENNFGRAGQQAVEIRADSEAVDLLFKSRLPVDALFNALTAYATHGMSDSALCKNYDKARRVQMKITSVFLQPA